MTKNQKLKYFNDTFDGMNSTKFENQLTMGHSPFKVGLANVGNSCFINSILQCLFHIKEYIPTFTGSDLVPLYYSNEDWFFLRDFANIMGACYINEFSKPTLKNFYKRIFMFKSLFPRDRQNDAFEFLKFFLSRLKKLFEQKQKAIDLANTKYELNLEDVFDAADKAHQILNQCWLGYRQRTVCEHGHESIEELDHEIISLDVDRVSCINQSISRFFADVVFGRCMCHIDSCFCNAYYCRSCNKHVSAVQTRSIISFPDVLILHLNLFHEDYNGKVKTF